MTSPKLRPAHRKTQRRWRIPPVLTQGPEVFEGLGVLDEVPGDCGVALWQALRDASLWAESAPEQRARLFHTGHLPSLPLGRELAGPVREIQALCAAPAEGEPRRVAAACAAIAAWAEAAGHFATALAFAQVCALAEPMDAEAACEVARLARVRAEDPRAETWYRRTVAVARQRGDWATYSRAFLGLGALHARRGNLSAARRFHMRAFRAANRNSLHELEARALHKLFSVAAAGGRRAEAVRLAGSALELYGSRHPRASRLALDVARHWVDGGHFARVLPVLRALLPRLDDPAARVAALAELAHAAAGTGDADAFLDAWTEACEGVRDTVAEPPIRALLALARAAAALGAWGKAESAARRARQLAVARGETRVRAAAEALLAAAEHRALPAATAGTEPAGVAAAANALAAALVHALRG